MKILFIKLHCYLCGFEMLVNSSAYKPLCLACGKQIMVVIGHVYKEE